MQNVTVISFGKKEFVWLQQGIKLMALRGLVNFKVDDLSKLTGKAKTSFYHFFNSREEYLVRLAEYWEVYYTDAYIDEILKVQDPRMQLEKLIELAYPNMKDELIWVHFKEKAISNPEIKCIVERAEAKRVDLISKILRDMNYPFDVAHEKANAFIYLLFGWSVLQQDETTRARKIEQFKKFSFDLLLDRKG